MKYVSPKYLNEAIESNDIILLSSVVDLGNGAKLTQVDESHAKVGASALDILGLR